MSHFPVKPKTITIRLSNLQSQRPFITLGDKKLTTIQEKKPLSIIRIQLLINTQGTNKFHWRSAGQYLFVIIRPGLHKYIIGLRRDTVAYVAYVHTLIYRDVIVEDVQKTCIVQRTHKMFFEFKFNSFHSHYTPVQNMFLNRLRTSITLLCLLCLNCSEFKMMEINVLQFLLPIRILQINLLELFLF